MRETLESTRELIGKGYLVTLLAPDGTKRYAFRQPGPLSIVDIRFHTARAAYQLALYLRGSGLCALDCDSESAVRNAIRRGWVSTLANRTRRGVQYLFQHGINEPRNRIQFCEDTDLIFNNPLAVHPAVIGGVQRQWLGPVPRATDLPLLPEGIYVEPRPPPKTSPPACPGEEQFGRAMRYVLSPNTPIAVSGQKGSNRFFWTLCRVLTLFPGLSWDQFVQVATAYSDRCNPPWSEREIAHKCVDSWKRYH